MNTGNKNKIWGSGMDVYGTVCGSQADGCEHDNETWGLINWADTGLAKTALLSEGIS
jgi:hypothetical protein